MNLLRIGELNNLIRKWREILEGLTQRKSNLELEAPKAENAPGKLEAAVASAKNRVSALAAFGLRSEFLEDIIRPVQNSPDCSGIETTVSNELSGIDDQITATNGEIWWADAEKKRLETEDEVCPQ